MNRIDPTAVDEAGPTLPFTIAIGSLGQSEIFKIYNQARFIHGGRGGVTSAFLFGPDPIPIRV